MKFRFQSYHPYLSFSENSTCFVESNGRTSNWFHANTSLSDDAAELWHLGRDAFKSLPNFESAEDFDGIYLEHLDGIKMLAGVLQNEPGGMVFINLKGERWNPDFMEASSCDILDVFWKLSYGQGGEFEELKHHYLFACLEEIDDALISLCLDSESVRSVIGAVRAYGNFQAIESGNEKLKQARSELAHRAATERHKRDPKQAERGFVFECWRAWQLNPETYKGKAAFARDMLDKCEHITSQKNIEDWCREWESKSK